MLFDNGLGRPSFVFLIAETGFGFGGCWAERDMMVRCGGMWGEEGPMGVERRGRGKGGGEGKERREEVRRLGKYQ